MGLNSIKILLLILCLVNLASSEVETYNFDDIKNIKDKGTKTFQINFSSQGNYKEYIKISLESEKNQMNPTILISNTDSECSADRLYLVTQVYDPIYIFLKKEQISSGVIYICIKVKDNSESNEYNIIFDNEDSALIPFNSQASYYISDQNTENMKFTFIKPEDETISSDSKVTIWLRGNYIEKPSLASFTEETFDSSYVFYGSYSENLELEVKSNAGDYIIIGSTIISDKKTHELKENANEIMVASEEEVCLPIIFESTHSPHITGKIFTRKADAYFKDESGNNLDKINAVSPITNGILSAINCIGMMEEQYMDQKGYFCLKSSIENKPLVFAIQMISNRELNMVSQPLYPGEFRRHLLMKHEIAIFYGTEPKGGATEVNFNLKAIQGFPYMYYDGCTTFPDCTYTEQSIQDKNLTQPYPSNRISVYSFYLNNNPEYKKFNPIGKFQPLMVVHCGDGYNKEEFFPDDSFCIFETAILTNKDTINIYEESYFSQYLLSGEEDDFKISLIGDDNLDKIYLDMLIFSGDASLELDNFSGTANKYYLSNKIFYSIHLDNYNENSLNFKVKATNATFYMVNYQLIKKDNTDDANTIESGVNYITSKYEDKDSTKLVKHLDFINYGVDFNQSYLISLFSPNCLFDVDWVHNSNNKERITTFNNTSQYIIKHTDPDYNNGKYTFEYDIQFDDMTEYSKKFCMVYASGIELTSGSADNWNGRSISLSEGVPHRYTYTKDYPVMFYAYHMSDYSKTLVLNFNLIDKDYFNITLKVGKQFLRSESIYRNTQLYITNKDVEEKCEQEEVCTIIAIVSLFNLNKNKTVELTAYQIDDNPFYLEKNAIKQDIIHGNKYKYYYFDIGKGEYGDITLDVKRGSGNIYATVVERNLQTPMDEPQWRGKYHFPTTVDESLKYDKYAKKIYITENSTEKCDDGCYVLISIVSSLQYYGQYEDETTPYRISINTRIYNQDTYIGNPKVRMQVNEFVIGNIDFSKKSKDRIDYYMVTLPYDSPYILIDWQADLCSFMINVGTNRPYNDSHHFNYPTIGHDYVYKIDAKDIINYSDNKDSDSTKGITLTIGIYSDNPDTMNSSPYAFKIFMPPTIDKEYELAAEIIHIRSDQKVQCLPFNYDNNNVCVFAVVFDEMDYNHNLVLYPRSNAHNSTIRGKLVDAERIERNDPNEIMKVMEEINADESCIVHKKYIYLNKIPKHQTYVLIINEYNHFHTIEVLSSTLEFYKDISIFPNPSSAQIFAMQDYTANINFETTKDLLINLVSLSGEGCFYWGGVPEGQEKKYYLNGYEDRLTLTSKTSELEEQLSPLIAKPLSPLENNPEGFVFYITFYPRGIMDQLREDRNIEINYRRVLMPLSYYAPINRLNSYSISFNFYEFYKNNQKSFDYNEKLFNIWATIIGNETVIKARYDQNEIPKYSEDTCIKGVFDTTFGSLYISSEEIHKLFKEGEQPFLFLSVEKDSSALDFDTMGLEISIHSDYMSGGYHHVPEGVYFNGKISKANNNAMIYSLSHHKRYVLVEYAANSDKIKFAITTNKESEETDAPYIKSIYKKSGRLVILMELDDKFIASYEPLYLKIFSKQNYLDEKLDNYIFRYSVEDEESSLFIPFLDDSKSNITVGIDNDNKLYSLEFNPIKSNEFTEVNYYVKMVYKKSMLQEEEIDTIAISESPAKHFQLYNQTSNTDEKISIKIPETETISYIKVIAMIGKGPKKFYYLYTPYEVPSEQKKLPKTKDLTSIEFSADLIAVADEAYKTQKYKLTFNSNSLNKNEIQPYTKIRVSHKNGAESPIIYSSLTDEDCKNNRLQLSKDGVEFNEMWIKKEQLGNQNYIYFVVECLDENNCAYNIEFGEDAQISLDSVIYYSYYVNNDNTEMVFRYKNEANSLGKYLTMYVTGSNNVKLTLKDCEGVSCSQFNFADGAAITTVISLADYYYLTVNAVKGSYITVGAKIVDKEGKSSANVLKPEIGPLSGFLRKDLLEKECYKLPDEFDVYFIAGTLYGNIANITYLYDEINYIPEEMEVHKGGFFSSVYNSKDKKRTYVCISFLNFEEYPLEGLSYSIQIQSKSKFKNIYAPQSTGFIYPRIMPTNKLAYFNSLSPKVTSERIVYNMITLEGYPKMYLYECKTYPSCELNYDDDLESRADVERVAEINRMSTLSLLNKETSPIDANQTVLVVKCIKANTTEDYELCKFMTSIFGEKEQVKLIEAQPFGQYILPEDKDTFLIDFSNENLKEFKVHIDFLVVSGDVSFELKNADKPDKKIDLHNYNLANKIFYSITVNETTGINTGLKRISIDISTRIHSYYIMEYKIIKHPGDENLNYIFSNIDYLIPLFITQDENEKEVSITSVKIITPQAYLATFYSLNCMLNVYKFGSEDKQQLPFFGNYGQHYFSINEENPSKDKYEYAIEISKQEKAGLNNKDMCMIYVSGHEIYPSDSGIRKEILVSEGVPQRIIFQDDLTKIRYLYPHSNPEKNITVSINMIVPGKIRVKIFFREQSYNQDEVYSQSTIIFIKREWIQGGCRENELCTITVELEKIEDFHERETIIETTIKQIYNEPYYLPRGILRNDFISGDAYLFLYTDVGKNNGYITINFYRGSGFIYAKVVEINQQSEDDKAEWRNFRFPRTKEESLYYDFYNKKIIFNEDNTKNCGDGCYILISIKTSVIRKDILDNEFQYFSILAEYSPKDYELKNQMQRKINIDPEEYVIGSLYEDDDINKIGIYDYYSIVCPYDAPGIEIDWQSETAELLINIGGLPPDIEDSNFNFTNRRNTNIFLSKRDILAAYNGGTYIENQNLTTIEIILGIYTKYYDSVNSTVYSFRVHFSELDLNIYKINSDHKTICKPDKLSDNQYRCLFMVIYEQFQYFNDLVIYAKSQSSSAVLNMYASYIDNEIYNSYDVQKLRDNIPDDNNNIFSTKKEKTNFIFLSYGDFHKNAYISVISDNEATIELYTSMKTFEDKLSPNPSSPQVYAIDKFKDDLSLDFITTKSIGINIISLYGEANIYLEKDPNTIYYLRGRDDGLELMLPQNQDSNSLLVIKRIKSEREGDNLYPGFIFLIEFNKRTTKLNFDEIKSDEVSEISYKDGDFPVYYYSKLFDTEKDITIFFYLHDLVYSDPSNFDRKMTTDELSIKGAILEEEELFQIKKDGKIPDMKVIGKYDPTMQAGNIIISQKELNSNTLSKPTLYLGIEKADKIKDIKYNGVRGEIGFSFINGDSPLTQKLYQFGKIKDNNEIHSYKLRADNNTNYMRIQFSANSKYMTFSISDKPNEKENIDLDDKDEKEAGGISFLTFKKPENLDYLYINIYLKEDSKNDKLNNYVFKYINSDTKEGFYEYKILNDESNIEINKKGSNKIDVAFNPIDYKSQESIDISIIYRIKLVTNSDKIEDENTDTISITESYATTVQHKPELSNNRITKELDNIPDDINYIQIIAEIKQGSIIEYVAYQAFIYDHHDTDTPHHSEQPETDNPTDTPHHSDNPPPTSESSTDKTELYIGLGVGGAFLVIAIILAIFLYIYYRRNKNLMDQVNKISFVQSGAKEKNENDTNLLIQNENELD